VKKKFELGEELQIIFEGQISSSHHYCKSVRNVVKKRWQSNKEETIRILSLTLLK